MSKELEEIMDQLTIPKPPTVKNSKYRLKDDRKEAKRLFKSLKSGRLLEISDLTDEGIELVARYYPVTRRHR